MEVIHTEVDVEAPDAPGRVWRTLIDFPAYPEWNPFIRRIEGEPRVGARLTVEIQVPGDRAVTFRPKVIKLEPGLEMRWLEHLIVPGLFDGEHSFIVETFLPDRVRFFQREIFRGVLVGAMGGTLRRTRRGFDEMNLALKARAESAPRSS